MRCFLACEPEVSLTLLEPYDIGHLRVATVVYGEWVQFFINTPLHTPRLPCQVESA